MWNSPVWTHTQKSAIQIDISEVLRYMGCASAPPDETLSLAKRAIEAMQSALQCRACYMFLETETDTKNVRFSFTKLQSSALAKHLYTCFQTIIFAATIGIEPDRLIMKASHEEPSFALALQAAGAAAIEKYCDVLMCEVFEKHADAAGGNLTSRFSAGYADLALENQKQIFAALDCERKIGLTLTDGYMMTPSKSVTAFVGIGKKISACTVDKCKLCKNENCSFRKGL